MRGPDESVADAQTAFRSFVANHENEATKAQISFWSSGNSGLTDTALAHFGAALHAIVDSTSPMHSGFQTWDWRNPLAVAKHFLGEASISPQQMSTAVSVARSAFVGVFADSFEQLRLLEQQSQARRSEKISVDLCYPGLEKQVCFPH